MLIEADQARIKESALKAASFIRLAENFAGRKEKSRRVNHKHSLFGRNKVIQKESIMKYQVVSLLVLLATILATFVDLAGASLVTAGGSGNGAGSGSSGPGSGSGGGGLSAGRHQN